MTRRRGRSRMSGSPKAGISRRDLLWRGCVVGCAASLVSSPFAAALAGPGISSATELRTLPARPPGSTGTRVIVVGAGLAGLAAAWELHQAGHDVTVLEARTRPGGRVRTVRDDLAGGLYSEVGAVAFSSAYTAANHYIEACGLESLDFAFSDLPALYHLRGRRFSHDPAAETEWPYDLTAEERRLGPGGMLSKYLIDALPDAGSQDWRRRELLALDELSLEEFMRRQGASADAIELLANTQYFLSQPELTSALSVALVDIGLFFRGQRLFVLSGGNDQLPRAMAARLKSKILYGAEVTALSTDDKEVRVSARGGGRTFDLAADRAIVTVPAPVLQGLDLDPALPADQHAALARLPYRPVVRAQVQVRRGFWHDQGTSGAVYTDLFNRGIERQPYFDAGAPERRAVLEAFFEGPSAARLQGRPDAEIMTYALEHMERAHPRIREFAEGGIVKSWSDDPFARGAYSWNRPGDVRDGLELLQRPHGRIHFAGEHTSILRATMEGALRSGIRAAGEVDA